MANTVSTATQDINIFCKNAVFNIGYLKRFHIYKKTNKIFFKFHHSLLRMSKLIKSLKLFLLKSAKQKHNQHAYKQVRVTIKTPS